MTPPEGHERSLANLLVSVIDWETTGTDPLVDHAVSVAVIQTRLLVPCEPKVVFKAILRCPVPIPPEATALHGLTDADCARRGRDAREVVSGILPWLRGTALCSYNLPFDWRLLDRYAREAGKAGPAFGDLDPLVWARAIWPAESNTLRSVAERLGYRHREYEHSAEHDAVATARALTPMARRVLAQFLHQRDATVGDLWAWTCERGMNHEKGGDAWKACAA